MKMIGLIEIYALLKFDVFIIAGSNKFPITKPNINPIGIPIKESKKAWFLMIFLIFLFDFLEEGNFHYKIFQYYLNS